MTGTLQTASPSYVEAYGIICPLGPASSSDRATASVRRGTTDTDWVRRTL
jgi:hypothetical protein